MTVENWNNILTACLVSNVPTWLTMFYLLSCQLILAYILHNLFQAILLQGFEDSSILQDNPAELLDEYHVYINDSNDLNTFQEGKLSNQLDQSEDHDTFNQDLTDDDDDDDYNNNNNQE